MKPAREAKRANRKRNAVPSRRDRGLHERGQVEPAQPHHAGRRARRERAVRDPRRRRSAATPRPTAACTRSPTPSASCATCRTSSSRRSGRRSKRSATPTSSCTSSTRRTPTPPARSPPCATSSARSAPATSPSSSCSTRPTSSTPEDRLVLRGLEPDAIFASARTGEGIAELLERDRASCCPTRRSRSTCWCPYDRGEVVSTLHATGAGARRSSYDEDGTRIRALASPELAAQLAHFAAASRPDAAPTVRRPSRGSCVPTVAVDGVVTCVTGSGRRLQAYRRS